MPSLINFVHIGNGWCRAADGSIPWSYTVTTNVPTLDACQSDCMDNYPCACIAYNANTGKCYTYTGTDVASHGSGHTTYITFSHTYQPPSPPPILLQAPYPRARRRTLTLVAP